MFKKIMKLSTNISVIFVILGKYLFNLDKGFVNSFLLSSSLTLSKNKPKKLSVNSPLIFLYKKVQQDSTQLKHPQLGYSHVYDS